jgi:hypothetical protein
MSTYVSNFAWARHIMPVQAISRVTRRNNVIIVPFEINRISAYARLLASVVGNGRNAKAAGNGPSVQAPVATVAADPSGTSGKAAAGGPAAGGGDDGDADGDGDGDGDGPRRKPAIRRKPSRVNSARRSPTPLSTSTPDGAHSHALIAFIVVTALILGTVLAFGLNGQPVLAEKVLGAFVSVGTMAAVFLRPK